MADEIQPAQTTAAKSPSPAHVNATGSYPHLLSLPDNVLHELFGYLSVVPGAAGYASGDALSLAATCRQLDNYYRVHYVVELWLFIGPHTLPDTLFRALERLPRVCSIKVGQSQPPGEGDEDDAFEAYRCLLPKTAFLYNSRCLQSRALEIKRFYQGISRYHGEEEPTECVRCIVETFSSLETLYSSFRLGDGAVTAIAENLSNSLQKLSVSHLEDLSDVGGVRLGELRSLRALEMRSFIGVTDVTFDALGALEELIELRLSDCPISDTAACKLVARLRKLTVLSLAYCQHVTCAIFRFLPRSLVGLTLQSSIVGDFDRVPPYTALEGLPNLTSFTARGCPGVNDLSFFWPVAARLQTLCLTGAWVSDANVAHWVRQMPNLLSLGLRYTNVSDETARAVSALDKIIEANLDCTEISIDGVRALLGGVACQSLQWLTLDVFSNVSVGDVAVEELYRKVSGNRKRSGMYSST